MPRSEDKSRHSRDPSDYFSEDRWKELERKRREWRIEQEKRREHEKRKQKMIEEYEAKRARALQANKQRRRSKSRSRSLSSEPGRRSSRCKSPEKNKNRTSSGAPVMSEKSDPSSSNNPVFRGSEGGKINVNDLKKIKVNIQRNIANAEETTELLRDITSPDEIVVKRREGEGSKPIFDRDELRVNERSSDDGLEQRRIVIDNDLETGEGSKPIFEREELQTKASITADVAERRTVITVDKTDAKRNGSSGRRSRSLSSGRRDSHSSRRASRYDTPSKSRADDHRRNHSHDRGQSSTSDRYYDRKYSDRKSSQRSTHDSRSRRSPSRDRNSRADSHQDSAYGRYDYEGQSHRRSVGERGPPVLPYVTPYPMYYDGLVRPMMMDPMMMRSQMPMVRGRMPTMIPTFRAPYQPRFMPPEMFRLNAPPNQRYGRRFP